MKKYVGKELYLNDCFLDAKKSYLYKYYIGNIDVDDKLFSDEKEKVKLLIDNFIDGFSKNDTIEFFNILIVQFNSSIEKEYNSFINNIYDNFADDSLLKKYPFIGKELFKLKIKINKMCNLTKIYSYYINLPYAVNDAIKDDIKYKLDRVIANNKNQRYYDKVSDLIEKKYNDILASIDVKSNNEYDVILEEYVLFVISKYGKMDIERGRLLKEANELGINNRIINDLKNANNMNILERSLMDAKNYINKFKIDKQRANIDIERQKNISSIKGLLNLRMVSSLSYSDDMKKIISDKVKDILDKYKKKEIDDISFLKKIFFKDFDKDYAILERLGKEVKKDDKIDEQKENVVDDDFDVIKEMFKDRDLRSRKEKADMIYNKVMQKYAQSRTTSDSYQKKELLYKIINILNDYVLFKIDDISLLDKIGFKNYDADLNIIYDIYNGVKDNNHRRR